MLTLSLSVCDDETYFASALKKKLEHLCFSLPDNIDFHICEFHSAKEILHYTDTHPVHILFLDIELSKDNGFHLAEILIEKYPEMLISFVTSHNELVYDSFKYQPFRFVRKTHLDQELKEALLSSVKEILENDKIHLFHTVDGDVPLLLQNILYLESRRNYFIVHCTNNRKYTCRGTIAEIEKKLSDYGFFRIHAAYLVNMDKITYIEKGYELVLENHMKLTISKRKFSAFNNSYINYLQRKNNHAFNTV